MAVPPLKRIMYVEDDPDIQSIVRHSLEKRGDLVLDTCDTAVEAIARASRLNPDLAMLDIVLPDMDGGELYLELRKLPGLATLPAILVTSLAETQNLQAYNKLGTVGIIIKPFNMATLGDSINSLWSTHWQKLQDSGEMDFII